MKCHKGARENIFHLHDKILVTFFLIWTLICSHPTKYSELYDIPHNSETSLAPRYNRSLAENIGDTQGGTNKLRSRNGTPPTKGNKPRGTPPSGLQANKKTDLTQNKPPVGNTADKKKIDKRTKRPTGQSLQNVQKPPAEKGNTMKNGLTECKLKGDHTGGPKANNKSTKSTVQSMKGSAPTGLKVTNEGVQSVGSPAVLPPPSKLNTNKKKCTVPNSPKRKVPSSSKVSKKGEKATNSQKGSPSAVLKATNKDEPESRSSGKVKTFESGDNVKNDNLPTQKLNELLINQKDNKTPKHTSVQEGRNQLNENEKKRKPKKHPFKNAPPSGLVAGKRMSEPSNSKLKNKPHSGLLGNQKDTESPSFPLKNIPKGDLKNIPKGDLKNKPKESTNNVLKNIPAGEQKGNEKNDPTKSIRFPGNEGEFDLNIHSGEVDNKKYVTKVYTLKRGKYFNENLDGIIHGVNDKLTLELQQLETCGRRVQPLQNKPPALKEYSESNISKDYQLKNEQPDLKKYGESNISKDYQLKNKQPDLKAYNESHLTEENGLAHRAPTGLKEFEKSDETRDYGLKGYTDSEIKEPKIDDQSSSQGNEENINVQSDETVSTVAKLDNANKPVKNAGIIGNIPTDVDRIERTLETVFCVLKEDDEGELGEYIEIHSKKCYKLDANVKDGVKEYDEKLEDASYGFREKLPVTKVQEYDVVERVFDKPIKVKKENIKPIEHYTYTYSGSKPGSPQKNYGLLDFFSFTFNVLSDRDVYLVKKENMSLYKLGKEAMKGKLTQELMHEYVTHCVKPKVKKEKVKNKEKSKNKEQKGKKKQAEIKN
ncbi:Erythrocyte membrane protein 3 [Plasmodium coatneyi]|uniref:Erythrocyte membrane protein 3 n=1 Tax=Plasmodium coatneyi TaxID=208452 RepID=A0A1B1E5T4_9APIC|nr:Erythrocyte membrane protein 3 [Plasmodium coatneyi]ANQ10371.1 Erythrocyte membrane protein 3 [Plasmodium coatneyi]